MRELQVGSQAGNLLSGMMGRVRYIQSMNGEEEHQQARKNRYDRCFGLIDVGDHIVHVKEVQLGQLGTLEDQVDVRADCVGGAVVWRLLAELQH